MVIFINYYIAFVKMWHKKEICGIFLSILMLIGPRMNLSPIIFAFTSMKIDGKIFFRR